MLNFESISCFKGSEFTQYIIDAVIGEKDEKFFDSL